ncbi:MAG: hypothetical protein ABL877_06460 [Thiobacillus sp.]
MSTLGMLVGSLSPLEKQTPSEINNALFALQKHLKPSKGGRYFLQLASDPTRHKPPKYNQAIDF